MELWVYGIIAALAVVIIVLLVRLFALKSSVRKIADEFNEITDDDTNILISLSASDSSTRYLVKSINRELSALRDERRRLQNGDKELKNAVTNIAHDIRTPLTAVSGYLQLLDSEEKSEKASEYIALIKNRTEALKSLTEELFKYSVLSSESELRLENVDVGAVLEQCLAASYGMLTQKGIEPNIKISNVKIERMIDRSALCRIFENVISNAAKYSEGDLKVEMSDSGEIMFLNLASSLNSVSVARLFDRFYTVETGRTSTGLGLSIAKLLTERMNGKISAQYIKGVLAITIKF